MLAFPTFQQDPKTTRMPERPVSTGFSVSSSLASISTILHPINCIFHVLLSHYAVEGGSGYWWPYIQQHYEPVIPASSLPPPPHHAHAHTLFNRCNIKLDTSRGTSWLPKSKTEVRFRVLSCSLLVSAVGMESSFLCHHRNVICPRQSSQGPAGGAPQVRGEGCGYDVRLYPFLVS